MKLNMSLWNWDLRGELVFRRKRNNEIITGYTNRCIDGKYIICLDYDRIKLNWVIHELQFLQETFKLSDFHIFSGSEDCYHAVCLDKVSLEELVTIMRNTSIDFNYIRVPLYWGQKVWALRLSDKENKSIKYLKCLISEYISFREQSNAHKLLLELHFKIKVFVNNEDDYNKLVMCRYPI